LSSKIKRLSFQALPAVHTAFLAMLMVVAWFTTGSVSPPLPQSLADRAYSQSWQDRPESAVELFRRALAADSAFPYRWSDLGGALASAGQQEAAGYCFRRALELAPGSPQIAMRAANFYFQQGETGAALQQSAAVLRLTSDYNPMVFSALVRLGGSTSTILDQAVGLTPQAEQSFFRFLIDEGDAPRLFDTWAWMEAHSKVTRPLAVLWSAWLADHGRGEMAFTVWKTYAAVASGYGTSNWIDNPGFEAEPEGLGFDWRISPQPGEKAVREPGSAHSGRSSLRVTFDGSANLDFQAAAQRVWLTAGTYKLTAWVRTENLTSDQGIAVRINGSSTAGLTGNHDWTEVSTDFTVAGAPALTAVEVIRQHSWRFDGKLKGTAWLDDFGIRRIK
jgi:hypothetical protein